jgi:hypothetical protein
VTRGPAGCFPSTIQDCLADGQFSARGLDHTVLIGPGDGHNR